MVCKNCIEKIPIKGGHAMGLFGSLLSLPVKVVNVPMKVIDEVIGEKVFSAPLSTVAKVVEKVDEPEEED